MNRERLHGTFARLTSERSDEIYEILDKATDAGDGKSTFSLSIAGAYLLMHSISMSHSKASEQLKLCINQGDYAREVLDWVIDVFEEIDRARKQSN